MKPDATSTGLARQYEQSLSGRPVASSRSSDVCPQQDEIVRQTLKLPAAPPGFEILRTCLTGRQDSKQGEYDLYKSAEWQGHLDKVNVLKISSSWRYSPGSRNERSTSASSITSKHHL